MRESNRLILACASILLLAIATNASAGKNGPNKENAKLCQKNGWQSVVDNTGTSFADEESCVAYGAEGGSYLSAAQAAICLSDAYQSKATSNGDPFADAQACLDYVVAGETPVHCDFVGTAGDDSFVVGAGQVACGFGGDDWVVDFGGVSPFLGTFYGGAGNDFVFPSQNRGTFFGGDGDDRPHGRDLSYYDDGSGGLVFSEPLPAFSGPDANVMRLLCLSGDCASLKGGIFNGGPGNDRVSAVNGGTFNGGEGNDYTYIIVQGTFDGGAGDDLAYEMGTIPCIFLPECIVKTMPPVFIGGPGADKLYLISGDFFGVATYHAGAGNDWLRSSGGIYVNPANVSLDGGDDVDEVVQVYCANPPVLTNFEVVPYCP